MTPRPELLGLLRAARQEAEDDAPRLVLADWLDERGGPADLEWAELIRMQVELAPLPRCDPRHAAMVHRAGELAGRHNVRLPGVRFWPPRRGVVEKATFDDCGAFRRHGPAAFEAAPLWRARNLPSQEL